MSDMDYDEVCKNLRSTYMSPKRKAARPAADAIDQLRARVAELEQTCRDYEGAAIAQEEHIAKLEGLKDSAGQTLRSFADQLTELEAENGRLTGLINEVIDGDCGEYVMGSDWHERAQRMGLYGKEGERWIQR